MAFDLEGRTSQDVRDIHGLADEFDNVRGIMLDDFHMEMQRPGMSPDVMKRFREKARQGHEDLEVFVVVCDHMLASNVWDYLSYFDSITLWTWESENLDQLEKTFETCAAKIGDKQILLGLYLYDCGAKQAMPLERMKRQCVFALQQEQAGNIDGMVFLASCIGDLDFETVTWTKSWIEDVGAERLDSENDPHGLQGTLP